MDETNSMAINGNKIYGLQSNFSDAVVCYDIHVFEMIGNESALLIMVFVDGGFNPDLSRDGLIANNMITVRVLLLRLFTLEMSKIFEYIIIILLVLLF